MKLHTYCDNMARELSGVKNKIDTVVTQIDAASGSKKVGVLDQVNDLHIIKEELQGRIDDLKVSCGSAWSDPNLTPEREIIVLERNCWQPDYYCGCGCY